jgi:2-polyprenyl-3-methyl-5-hydroxy-6-metoxy-1,4-benzoquinol methylase
MTKETKKSTRVDPSRIMQVGMGFWASKILLAAVDFDIFTLLAGGAKDAHEIKRATGLHNRSLYDFLDALVALGFLKRIGLRDSAKYSNAEDVNTFLVEGKSTYIGGLLKMANHRLYGFWGTLEEGLKTGMPQNEIKLTGYPLFEALYKDHKVLEEFLNAMAGVQMANFMALAKQFDFTPYKTLCDMGGAGGLLSILVARENPHMTCTSYDMLPVEPLARKNINTMSLNGSVKTKSGDFFKDQFPATDVITMGNILHDWGLEDKMFLMRKAYDALPENGAFIAIENVIDNNRKENAFGLMMSLNMLIETTDGFDYTMSDFDMWAKEIGFRKTHLLPLAGPTSAAIAFK